MLIRTEGWAGLQSGRARPGGYRLCDKGSPSRAAGTGPSPLVQPKGCSCVPATAATQAQVRQGTAHLQGVGPQRDGGSPVSVERLEGPGEGAPQGGVGLVEPSVAYSRHEWYGCVGQAGQDRQQGSHSPVEDLTLALKCHGPLAGGRGTDQAAQHFLWRWRADRGAAQPASS